MYRDHTVAVVVPAYDEAPHVGDVVAEIPAFVDHVYLVDDASNDDTSAVALAAADPERGRATGADISRNPGDAANGVWSALEDRVAERTRRGRVTALRHGENEGAGGTVKTGYLAALAGGAELVATVDGDGQLDPARLDRFLEALTTTDADYVKGTRLRSREDRDEMPAFRLFGNAVLTLLSRASTGYWDLTDPVNGYTVITREALADVRPRSLYEGYGYGVQVLARLHAAGCLVADVPHPSAYGPEVSGIDYRTYVPRVSGLLVETLAWRLRRERLGALSDPGVAAAKSVVGDLLGVVEGVVSAVRGGALERGREP
ncbi:glycosyltransferase family 2 protein [Halobacterium wangiae]|uniref:glycosyltransferase family 2 protein n=1 Tax=Halobacterium wangiae TaxID=2902623 RepID=UPI001E3A599A|nr:glycosyltransferase family 2 protein [Halobacterium wangiae]